MSDSAAIWMALAITFWIIGMWLFDQRAPTPTKNVNFNLSLLGVSILLATHASAMFLRITTDLPYYITFAIIVIAGLIIVARAVALYLIIALVITEIFRNPRRYRDKT